MMEAEWLACDDPEQMLEFLHGWYNDRKPRLFAIACCHRVWELLHDSSSQYAIEMAEWFVEGRVTAAELQSASLVVDGNFLPDGEVDRVAQIAFSASCSPPRVDETSHFTARLKARVQGNGSHGPLDAKTIRDELIVHSAFLRDIFGNPFCAVSVDSTWLTSAVTHLAQAIYDDCAFDRLPILADALEDAGCTDRAILDHCRQSGFHVRGCWVVDLVLGKS